MSRPPIQLKPDSRILIVKPSSMGDIATALPLLCDIKAHLPAGRVDWVIQPQFADLIRGHDAIDRVIMFDRAAVSRCWRSADGWRAFKAFYGELRVYEYDLAIDAQGLLRSSLITRASGARQRVGFADAREYADRFYTHKVDIDRDGELAVVRMRHLFSPVAPSGNKAEFRVPVQAASRERMAGLLPAGCRVATVIPGARWAAKRWSEEGFSAIARRLEDCGCKVVVTGSAAERRLCGQVAGACRDALNLAGGSLADMIALLAVTGILVGNDSGPLHVAAALGTPLVGLYGPTDPASVGPYGQMDHVLRFDDVGDYRHNRMDRSEALRRLPVETVWQLVERLLPGRQAAAQ